MTAEVAIDKAVLRLARAAALAVAALVAAPAALADDAATWLNRAAQAARQLNYVGTILYQHGGHVETSRLIHLNDNGAEFEKLVNLDGPAREVIRSQGEVRCYYPDAKVVRIEPRTFRNAFPSLSPQQQKALGEYYAFRKAEAGRVAGLDAQAWVFEPKDGLRYGHKFWSDVATGLLLKARIIDERGEVVEQFAFTDLAIGGRIDREMVRPSWPPAPTDWVVRAAGPGDVELRDTGWGIARPPPGFSKIVEGFRALRGKKQPVAHLVYSDGLVAVSVFIENVGSAPHPTGLTQHGGTNIFVRQFDDHLVTVLGEAPAAAMRQFAASVTRR
ncbi:MAG: MucB/RseB C-terminal domain-containing protein [Betaproteobacteria bacterium]|nr:MucB/RseB C-terminal domain-containing protein [Betaproteobacteria bacterium]